MEERWRSRERIWVHRRNTNTTSPETGISLAQVQRGSEELLAWKN